MPLTQWVVLPEQANAFATIDSVGACKALRTTASTQASRLQDGFKMAEGGWERVEHEVQGYQHAVCASASRKCVVMCKLASVPASRAGTETDGGCASASCECIVDVKTSVRASAAGAETDGGCDGGCDGTDSHTHAHQHARKQVSDVQGLSRNVVAKQYLQP